MGMRSVVQILIEIPGFAPEVFIECPAEARKRAVLIEAGLAACGCGIDTQVDFVPSDQAQTRFKLQRMHESNHLPWMYTDSIAIARYEITFEHGSEGDSPETGRQDIAECGPRILL